MKHGFSELLDLVSAAGLRDPDGFPTRALMAAIAMAESRGDPSAWVAHDPPTNPNAGPSSGLFMVHQPDWPAIYRDTEAVRTDPSLSDAQKIVFMTDLAKPILADAINGALRASHLLSLRGLPTGLLETALFVDAAWQTGSPHLALWATRTATGDPREIVNAARTLDLEATLRDRAGVALGVTSGLLVTAGVVGGFLVGALLLSQLDF